MRITKRQLKKIIREQLSSNNSGEYFKYGIKKYLATVFENYMRRKGFTPDNKIEEHQRVNFTWSTDQFKPEIPASEIAFSELTKEINKFWSWLRLELDRKSVV